MTLTLKFDPIVKNINLGCYLVMVAALQASLSSDNSYFKVGQPARSMSIRQKSWYSIEGLVTRNAHVKYETPTVSGLEAMAKVKVFKSRSKFMVKVTRSKILVPMERSCHKECTNEIHTSSG